MSANELLVSTGTVDRATAAAWVATNPIIADGDLGLETDTGRIKFGDGATVWTSLPYYYTPSQVCRGQTAAWNLLNPVLAEGDLGLETDTGRIKFGDGTNAWNWLPYYTTGPALITV